ncbi:MAG: NADH-quinone oxidoreductase subunit NuoG [Acidithiobacillus sp.]|nr:NADH-quinone oxidoreductase subunit NuoG [Acidithiobacillus sp.]
MPRIEIDGNEIEVSAGTTLMEAAQQLGIYIPFFCYHPKLSVAANCRMCLVDVEKQAKPLPACATPASDGMKVWTRSKRAKMAQQGVLEFLLINHPLDCPICDQGGECPLQDITMGYANPHSLYTEEKRVVEDKDIGPLITTEMTRCIQCTRCVRFGTEIGGISELGATGRGEKMAIGTYVAKAVRSELSGNMIDLCPVGALTSKPFRYKARSWELKHSPSLCPHCSTGCNTDVQSLGKEVMRVKPRVNEAVNEEWLCDKGRFAYAGLQAADRLTQPLLRVEGRLQPVSWADALEVTAAGLQSVLAKYGPDAIAGLISPQASNEELYLFQALLRALGVRAVDHRLRQTDFRADPIMPLYPALNMSLEQLEAEKTIVLCHAYPREQQPLTNHRIRKAVLAGAQVWVLDSVRREFNYSIRYVQSPLDEGAHIYGQLLRAARGEPVSDRTVSEILQSWQDKSPLFLLGNGLLQEPRAAELLATLGELLPLVNGRISWLAEAANSAGAWLLGCVPHRQPAGIPVAHAPTSIWQDRRAFLLYGVEPERDAMLATDAKNALASADFVVQLGQFLGDGENWAHVVLPIASWAESSGTFFNNEGRLQSYRAAVKPVGESRPGWKVLRVLADHFQIDGLAFDDLEALQAAWQEALGDFPLDLPGLHTVPELGPVAQEDRDGELVLLGDWPIYQMDPLVRRSPPLQRSPHCRVHPETLRQQGIQGNSAEIIGFGGKECILPVCSDEGIPQGAVWVTLGYADVQSLGAVGSRVRMRTPSLQQRARA